MKADDATIRVAWGKVIARSWSDEDYKARLLDNPHAVLTEAGVDVPPDIDVKVVEQMPGQVVLTLPHRPDDEDMELDDSRLEAVAGAKWTPGWCW